MNSGTNAAEELKLLAERFGFFPGRADKKPNVRLAGDHNRFRHGARPTHAECEQWAGGMIGLWAGENGLGVIDIDDDSLYEPFLQAVADHGLESVLARCAIGKTPHGHHVYCVVAEIEEGSQKLACWASPRHCPARGKDVTVRIETRAVGAYAIVPPSPGYTYVRGSLLTVETITLEEWRDLCSLARLFDERQPQPVEPARGARNGNGSRPGDDYNGRGPSVLKLLLDIGWQQTGRTLGGWTAVRRPGKSSGGLSGTVTADGQLFYCFSTNAVPFEAERSYSAFGILTMVEHGGDFKAAAKALARQGYGQQPGTGGGAVITDATDTTPGGPEVGSYREHNGRIERLVRNREGDSWAAVTENFTARIVEQIEIDDGVEHSREYAVEGVCDGRALRRVRVPARSFDGLGWIGEHWGAFPIVKVGQSNTSHAATAMKMLGRSGMVERTIYQHLGWREIGGVSVYLHAGGGLGTDGVVPGIETVLPNQLSAYVLAEVVGLSRADALRASMTFLRAATADVAGTLYAALWRSVIGDVNFSAFLTGPTGTQKSSLASALVSHFGSGLTDKEDLGVQWSSTANAIEGLLFSAKDAILPVDDYVPSRGTMVDRAQMQKTASRVLRAAGNRAGRSRMFADGTVRPSKPPRAMLLATGEELPDGGSELRRTVVVTLERDGVDLGALSKVQEHGHRGANVTAMVAFVRWVAERRAKLRERLRTATQSSRDGSRLSEQLAELRETVGIWCEYAAECGLGREEIEEARAVMTAGVASVGKQQELHSKDQDPVTRYLELLTDGLASGALAVVERPRPAPDMLGSGRSFIGWEDDDHYYLNPTSSFAAISKLADASHRSLQLSISALHRALRERGVVSPQGSSTVGVLQMGGKGTRVLKMPKSLVCVETHSTRSQRSEDGGRVDMEPASTTDRATPDRRQGVAQNVAAELTPGALNMVAMSATPTTPFGNDGYVVIE